MVEPSDETLLVEYQKAQDSAEHHDKLIWIVTSIFFAGIIALLGFLAKDFQIIKDEPIAVMISILGIIMVVSLGLIIQNFKFYKNMSYWRCQEIEKELGMKQQSLKNISGKKDKPEKPLIRHQWLVYITLLVSISIVFVLIILNYFGIINL